MPSFKSHKSQREADFISNRIKYNLQSLFVRILRLIQLLFRKLLIAILAVSMPLGHLPTHPQFFEFLITMITPLLVSVFFHIAFRLYLTRRTISVVNRGPISKFFQFGGLLFRHLFHTEVRLNFNSDVVLVGDATGIHDAFAVCHDRHEFYRIEVDILQTGSHYSPRSESINAVYFLGHLLHLSRVLPIDP